MGGGLFRESDGKWRTTNYGEGDNFGISGDRLRVEATAILYKQDPNQIIIVSGGKGQLKDVVDAPCISTILKSELMELGIPNTAIVEERVSGNSYQQLLTLKKLQEHLFFFTQIITNIWHIPRTKALTDHIGLENVEFVGAEKIVSLNDPEKWNPIIKSAYSSDALKKRIAIEKKGIEDIKAGTYNFV